MIQAIQQVNPNTQTGPSTPERHTDDPFEFLRSDQIEQLRQEQHRLIEKEQRGIDPLYVHSMAEARRRAEAKFEDLCHEYLHSFGLSEDSDYDDYYEWIVQASVDNMSDMEWRTGTFDKDGNQIEPSGRDMMDTLHDDLLDEYNLRHGKESQDSEQGDDDESDKEKPKYTQEELDEQIRKIETKHKRDVAYMVLLNARDKLADVTFKYQQRASKENEAEYRQALHAYENAMRDYARAGEEMLDAQNPNRTDDEKNATVIAYLLHEAQMIREKRAEKWAGYADTAVNRFCMWMVRGNVAQRIAKGVLFGSAVGAAAALTGGVGGGVIVAAGTAPLLRLARAYAGVRGHELLRQEGQHRAAGTQSSELKDANRSLVDNYASRDELLGKGSADMVHRLDAQVGRDVSESRRRRNIGMGAAVIGLASGAAATAAVESGALDKAADWVGDRFGSADRATSIPPRSGEGTMGTVEQPTIPPEIVGLIPDNPNAAKLITPEAFQNGIDVPVQRGDGFYKLADRYGLTDAQRDKLMDIMAARDDKETYMHGNDLRLNLGDRKFHLSPKELVAVLKAK